LQLPPECAPADDIDRLTQSLTYPIFAALYGVVFLWSATQLTRIIHELGLEKPVALIVHVFVTVICSFRILSMLSYVAASSIEFWVIALLAGVPYLFIYQLYTFVLYAWIAFYNFAAQVESESSRFRLKGILF